MSVLVLADSRCPTADVLFWVVVGHDNTAHHFKSELCHTKPLVDECASEAVFFDGKDSDIALAIDFFGKEFHDAIDFMLVVIAADDFFRLGNVLDEKEGAMEFDSESLAEFASLARCRVVIAYQAS